MLHANEHPLEFSAAKRGDRVIWAVVNWAPSHNRDRPSPGKDAPRREWLVHDVEFWERKLQAEGVAATKEEAWTAACAAVGHDRMAVGTGRYVNWLREVRHRLQEHDRLASLQPKAAEASPIRYVYREVEFDSDTYELTLEHLVHRERFRYERHQILRETEKFLFVSRRSSDTVDRDEVVDEEAAIFHSSVRGPGGTCRVAKAAFEVDGGGTRKGPIGAARAGTGYGSFTVWLSLEALAADCERRRQSRLAGCQPWRRALGIPADTVLTHKLLQQYYRRAARRTHPDAGGTNEAFHAVQEAWERASRLVPA
jgi:hypothetical protein